MNLFGGRTGFGMIGGSRAPGRKRKNFNAAQPTEQPEAKAGSVVEFRQNAKQEDSVADDPRWLKRGLFKMGFNAGSPRLRSARKYTK